MTNVEEWKANNLDTISCTFCAAKWQQVTIHLQTGYTHSCHHPTAHKIPLSEIKDNPSALHNTSFKKLQRKKMLEGHRPAECDYCWRVEDIGAISDRTYKSMEPWAAPYINELKNRPWDDNVTPSYLEVSFSNVCNFKCSYCGPQISSKWMEEIQQYGEYPTSGKFNSIESIKDAMPIPNREHNPFVEAFWKWWPEASNDLKHFRITGGEPLLSKDTFKVFDDLIENPRLDLEVSVNSNMCVPDELFEKFIEKIKIICNEGKVKKFKIFTSAEAHGAQAEYIRHGLNYNQWLSNIRRILDEVPNCTFTCMSTYNILSVFSFDKLLVDLLEIKMEYGGHGKAIPIILDTPYLRHPEHQAIFIAEQHWKDTYLQKQLSFIYNNLENSISNPNSGFYKWEGDKFKRILDIINQEAISQRALTQNRLDFVSFVDEHDNRRGTDFLKTFPEMEQAYYNWKNV